MDKELAKEEGNYVDGQILVLPQYLYHPKMGIYIETNRPPSSIFTAIGYNDQETAKKIFEETEALVIRMNDIKSSCNNWQADPEY